MVLSFWRAVLGVFLRLVGRVGTTRLVYLQTLDFPDVLESEWAATAATAQPFRTTTCLRNLVTL